MDFLATFAEPAIAVFAFVTLGFIVSIVLKRNDIADVMWGPGILLASLVGIATSTQSFLAVHLLLLSLTAIWAIRLAIRIYLKNYGKDEDARYATWRKEWDWFYLRSYLQVFLLQGSLMLLLASATILTAAYPIANITIPMYLGALVFVIGFLFETISDRQLDRFIQNPEKSGLMTEGLWRYSRHPNYFGEVTLWWGIWLIAFAATMSPWTLITPLTITILILFVSGIPMSEAHMQKKPGWDEYKRKTSVFVPWFVKE